MCMFFFPSKMNTFFSIEKVKQSTYFKYLILVQLFISDGGIAACRLSSMTITITPRLLATISKDSNEKCLVITLYIISCY
jgi:hypothetical protein